MSKFKAKNILKEKTEQKLDPIPAKRPEEEEFKTGFEKAFDATIEFLVERRKYVLWGIVAALTIFVTVLGVFQYLKMKERRAVVALEILLEGAYQSKPTPEKIRILNAFKSNFSSGTVTNRINKMLADLYSENKEYAKAAELLESLGSKLDFSNEWKAYFFYSAGLNREFANETAKALSDYTTANSLLKNPKETPQLIAWTLMASARILNQVDRKAEAKTNWKKVLEIDSTQINELKSKAFILLNSTP